MNKHFEQLSERCGTYISPYNMEANWREIDFLCEHVVRMCADWVEQHVGDDKRDALLNHFDIKP